MVLEPRIALFVNEEDFPGFQTMQVVNFWD